MQGVYDIKGRYLAVTIEHPGSTLDYLAFVTSKLHTKLETPEFKATSIIYYLHKLHNYCIDENKATHYEQTNIDRFYSLITGCVSLNSDGQGNLIPNELLGGGNCSDDYDCWRVSSNNCPQELILKILREKDLCMSVSNDK